MQITFFGATGTVTGSKMLVKTGQKHIMVECGLFQGIKALRDRNWEPLPFDPHTVDALVLTHAHIDHSGYVPLLVKNGFSGPIYCSKATKDLCGILLPDSAYLQEEDANFANKYGFSKYKPALPLYTQEDAQKALLQFKVLGYAKEKLIFDDFTLQLQRSGHILGSAFVTLREGDTSITFSGDLGRTEDPVMNPPVKIQETDYLVLECTYGDRLHSVIPPEVEIANVINKTFARGGSVVIPAFAVGRAQSLLYYIYNLKKDKKIPNIPVFLDSPMAVDATNILLNNMSEHKLSAALAQAVCRSATYVNTVTESKEIDAMQNPKIIISASGMADGGRVLHHLKALMPDPRNSILFSGYQAPETRGYRIINGERSIKIHGEMFPVNAEIHQLNNISAHADYEEILYWLGNFSKAPRRVFLTHGEPEAAAALKEQIEDRLGWDCVIPSYGYSERL